MDHFFNIPHLIHSYGYLGIFIIVFLESGIFFALPGDSLLFTAGLFASVFNLNLLILIPLIFIATFLGGLVGYEIGVNLDRLNKYAFFRKLLNEENIRKMHAFFHKYGAYAIIFSRFLPIGRTFIPIVAGMARVHYNFYIKYSLISSFLWSTTVTLLGYFLGKIFPHADKFLPFILVLIVIFSVVPIIAGAIHHKKSK